MSLGDDSLPSFFREEKMMKMTFHIRKKKWFHKDITIDVSVLWHYDVIFDVTVKSSSKSQCHK